MSDIANRKGSQDWGATKNRVGCGVDDGGTTCIRFDWKIVATKVTGRYNVAIELSAFMVFESLSRSLLSRVRSLASEFRISKDLDMAVLVP